MNPLINVGKFSLSSGKKADWKLLCDHFIDENLEGIVFLAKKIIGPFSSVEGIPRGGTFLAEALSQHVGKSGPHLVVDDVLTTGRSMDRVYQKGYTGFVVFARGFCPSWVWPLFIVHPGLWK